MIQVVRFMDEEMIDVGLVVVRINVWSTYKLGNLSLDCLKSCICCQLKDVVLVLYVNGFLCILYLIY